MSSDPSTHHRIPPPAGDKEPLKTNVFELMRAGNSTLLPFFPYLDEGAIVPAGTVYFGPRNTHYGFFQHYNDVDEVFIIFAAEGVRFRSGTVRVGPRSHFVGSPFMGDSEDEDGMALVVITQRQSVGKPQRERMIFNCEKCRQEILNYAYDSTPCKRGTQIQAEGYHAPFKTLVESVEAYARYNRDTKCPKCGHQNQPFPVRLWGNDLYVIQTELMRQARGQLARDAAAEG